MNATLALGIIAVMCYWLLRNDAKRHNSTSALWIPTVWMFIMGSRPLGAWLHTGTTAAEGSPYDQVVLNGLFLLAIITINKRNLNWSSVIANNRWLMVLYLYLLLSIIWSDFPFNSFKRVLKITETIIIAFVLLTEKNPFESLLTIFRRCSYILLPLSLVLIKYVPEYGVAYTNYEGAPMGTGVTTHKNSLGILCAILGFIQIWYLINKLNARQLFKNKLNTFVDLFVLFVTLFLLFGGGKSYSATSITIFLLGTAFMLIFKYMNNSLFLIKNLKVTIIFFVIAFLLLNNVLLPKVSTLLNRNTTLTGRDKIWESVGSIAANNWLLGTGFGGFWGLEAITRTRADVLGQVNQAHNGYLNIYLQTGLLGISFLVIALLSFCDHAKRMFEYSLEWATFGACYIMMLLLYNYSEAGFLSNNFIWSSFIFLTISFSAPVIRPDNTDYAVW